MTTAFVLSGGGNLGAIQVGMLRALHGAGIRPDLVVGTSVGALNGAWLAARGRDTDPVGLADVWRRLRRNDVFPTSVLGGVRGMLGHVDHLVSDSGLRKLIGRELGIERLEQARIPVYVVATDIRTGSDHLIGEGDAVDAICASAAIPGVFPSVSIGSRQLVDGGVVNNCPISHAVSLGATTVWVLPCGYSCSLDRPPKGALASAMHAVSLMIQQRLKVDADRYRAEVDLRIVPTLCPVKVSPTDFSRSAQLVDDAMQLTRTWLADPARSVGQPLGLHRHG